MIVSVSQNRDKSGGEATKGITWHDSAVSDDVSSCKPTGWHGLLEVVMQNSDQDLPIERRQTHTRRDPCEGLPQ
jgi:hypothetical protein